MVGLQGNPCFTTTSFSQFCAGTPCIFDDYGIIATPDSSLCHGSSVDLVATGGSSYQWSTGASTAVITVNSTEDTYYHLTLTTLAGCHRTDSILISVNDPPIPAITGTDVTTIGGSDGTATVLATGGHPLYDFLWSTGQTTSMITGLSLGTYYITVSDQFMCYDTASITLSQPNCPVANSPCDDGDTQTMNDVEDGFCNCSGTLGGRGCHPDFDALMAIFEGTNGSSWNIPEPWGHRL